MDDNEAKALTKLEWGVIGSLIASTASLAFTGGVVYTKTLANERDIAVLKSNDQGQVDRLARIETKLDIMLAERGLALRAKE